MILEILIRNLCGLLINAFQETFCDLTVFFQGLFSRNTTFCVSLHHSSVNKLCF
jgi:hypothetical protein